MGNLTEFKNLTLRDYFYLSNSISIHEQTQLNLAICSGGGKPIEIEDNVKKLKQNYTYKKYQEKKNG